MTTYTTAELSTRVLKDLGLIDADATPSASDMAWATETVQSEVMMMSAKGIPIWNGSETSVPQEYLTILSRRCGLAIGVAYGLIDIASATIAMDTLEANLRRLGQVGPTGEVAQSDYF